MAGENLICDDVTEENGAIVKRVTLVTIYHKVKTIEKNQEALCEKLDDLIPKVEEVNGHAEKLDKHIKFCHDHRSGISANQEIKDAYERGRLDVIADADKKAEERLKKAMYFWVKILIPATAVLLGLVYYLGDRLVF